MQSVTVSQSTRLVPTQRCINRTGAASRPFSRPANISYKRKNAISKNRLDFAARANVPTTDARFEPRLGDKGTESETEIVGRKIVFGVDGTSQAEEGLRWLIKEVARKGDTIHLAHVIADPRTPTTSVGSSSAGAQWSPSREEATYSREFFSRKMHEAQSMMSSRFIPSIQFTGINHQVDLLRLKLHNSAAGIGETLASHATNIGADLLVIASHGAGVLADYGSVARWCSEHSQVPALLLPPAILQPSQNKGIPSNTVLVAAAQDLEGLREAFHFAVREFTQPGDNVYVVHASQPAGEEEEQIAARKDLVGRVLQWQSESEIGHALTLNIAVDLVTDAFSSEASPQSPSADSELFPSSSPVAARLCAFAEDLNARAVVLRHYGRSMMREMMYGPVMLCCTKNCVRPLVVLGGAAANH